MKDKREILADLDCFELVLDSQQVKTLETMTVLTPRSVAMEALRKLMEDSDGKPDVFLTEDMEYPTWLDLALYEVTHQLKQSIDFTAAFAVILRYDTSPPFIPVNQMPEPYEICIGGLQEYMILQRHDSNGDPLTVFEDYACLLLCDLAYDSTKELIDELASATTQLTKYEVEVRMYTEKPDFNQASAAREYVDGTIYRANFTNGEYIKFIPLWGGSVWITMPWSINSD